MHTQFIQRCALTGEIIPEGVYEIDAQILVNQLRGSGKNTVIKTTQNIPGGAFIVGNDSKIENCSLYSYKNSFLITNNGVFVSNVKIENCNLYGVLPQTQYLIDITSNASNICINNCTFSNTYYGIRLKENIKRVYITKNSFEKWRSAAIMIRGGIKFGPQYVYIEDNVMTDPVPESGFSKQMICAYGDPVNPKTNILDLHIRDNYMSGLSKCFEQGGTGDQVALHCCMNFSFTNNISVNGGENGVSITRDNKYGLIANNNISYNDGHGLQVSRLTDGSTDIHILDNTCIDNGIRRDNFSDVMAGIFLQDASRIVLDGNTIEDTRIPRRQKCGVLLTTCKNIIGKNSIKFADATGINYNIFQSQFINLE